MSGRRKALLTQLEGDRQFVYDDATGDPVVPGYTLKGHPTVGIGRCLDLKGLSVPERQRLLDNDDAECEILARRHFQWFPELHPVRRDVIVMMIFQLGLDDVRDFRQMLAAINRGDFEEAAREMLDSRWHQQTPKRCELMAEMMRIAAYPGEEALVAFRQSEQSLAPA
jgi:lysozyme